jgi:hypothetical protein
MAAGNPAHHLKRLLETFETNAGAKVSVHDCWVVTLGRPHDFAASLAAAASLVPAVRHKVISHGLDDQLRLVNRYEDAWLKPFFPDDRGTGSHSQNLIDDDSLLALSSLSAIFGALEGIPALVGPEESQTLLGLLDEARAAVHAAGDLPAALRGAVLSRLQDVQWAIEQYNVLGPEGLQAALERLGAELARTSRRTGEWRNKVGTAFLFGWLLFSNADEVVADIEAGATIVRELGEWTDEASKVMAPSLPELGPGEAGAAGARQLEAAAGDDDIVDAEIVEKDDE